MGGYLVQGVRQPGTPLLEIGLAGCIAKHAAQGHRVGLITNDQGRNLAHQLQANVNRVETGPVEERPEEVAAG